MLINHPAQTHSEAQVAHQDVRHSSFTANVDVCVFGLARAAARLQAPLTLGEHVSNLAAPFIYTMSDRGGHICEQLRRRGQDLIINTSDMKLPF